MIKGKGGLFNCLKINYFKILLIIFLFLCFLYQYLNFDNLKKYEEKIVKFFVCVDDFHTYSLVTK